MEKKGFEGLGHEYYLVYELDTSKSADYPNLPALNRGPQTTKPNFMTWNELMDKRINMETQDISKNLGNGDILIYQSEDGI